jgi:cytochrome c-type biogenesis protein
MGVFRIAFLESEKRMQANRKPAGALGAMLVGIAFAFGWSPCIGPILGGIFLLTSIAINQFFAVTKRIRKHYHAIELVSGGLLIVIGVLIFTNQFTIIVRYLQPYLPSY